VSHGNIAVLKSVYRVSGGGGHFVGYAATAVTLGNDLTNIGPEFLFL
jgi:hypothetical protein